MMRLGPEVASTPLERGETWTLYYDGECGLCRRVRDILTRLDVTKQVNWVAYQSLAVPPAGLTGADLERAAYLDSGSRLEGGFYAFRRLSLGMPLLWPLAPVLWLPGISRVGEVAYRWVARNRRGLGCEADAVAGGASSP
jgi:predicted DCC family thiol-disulfide oxidoreductase YuxK